MEFSVHEDRLKTAAIDYATADDHVIQAVADGRLFVVTAMYLQAEDTVDVTVKSGATAIAGPIAMATATLREVYWSNGGSPIMRGRAAGDDLVLTLGQAIQVNGWVSYFIIDARNV